MRKILWKRGQITIFIIMGFIILLAAVFLFYMAQPELEPDEAVGSTSKSPIVTYIESCMEIAAREGIYLIASQGGYLNPSGNSLYNEPGDGKGFYDYFYYDNLQLPYLLDEETNYLRSKETIERMLASYIDVNMDNCFTDKVIFEQQGYEIIYSELDSESITVQVRPEDTIVKLYWPLSITQSNTEFQVDDFTVSVPLRLGLLYSITQQLIADFQAHDPYNIQNNCEEYIPEGEWINIYLDSNPYTYQYVLRVIDASPLEKANPILKFQFAVKNIEIYGECIG